MFVENQNYSDSLLFLGSARIALSNIVKESAVENKNKLCRYIKSEATDYEIMHLLVRESMPKERFNNIDEAELWAEFKLKLLANHSSIQEAIGYDIFTNVLTEIDSIYPLQSAESLFEYSIHVLQEKLPDPVGDIIRRLRQGGKKVNMKDVERELQKATGGGGAAISGAERERLMKAAGGNLAPKKAAPAGPLTGTDVASLKRAAGERARDTYSGAGGFDKQLKVGATGAARADDLQTIKRIAGKNVAKGQQAGFDKALKGDIAGAGRTRTAAYQAGEKVAGAQQAGQNVDLALKRDIVSSKEPKGFIDKLRPTIDSARELPAKISKFAQSPAGLAVGGAALGALAIYGATKAYKRFFSKAAKACAGMSFGDKTRCMNRYKVKALEKQMQDLKAGSSACKAAKNPDKCQGAITRKMGSLQKKIGKLQARGA